MFEYSTVYQKLTYELAGIVFLKKDGSIRLMLGTRNLDIVDIEYGFQGFSLGGHDNRCNINNGNIAVFDMVIGEARSFNIDRVLAINFYGEVKNADEYNKVFDDFVKFREQYESTQPLKLDMDMLD